MAQNKGRINEEQKMILVEFLEKNKELVNGLITNSFTAQDKTRLWEQVTNILNSCGTGSQKDAESWKGCWSDLKSAVKKKLAKYKKSIEETGGGFADQNPITPFEQRVAAMMGISTIFGIEGVNESGVEEFEAVQHVQMARQELQQVVVPDGDGIFTIPDNSSGVIVQLDNNINSPGTSTGVLSDERIRGEHISEP